MAWVSLIVEEGGRFPGCSVSTAATSEEASCLIGLGTSLSDLSKPAYFIRAWRYKLRGHHSCGQIEILIHLAVVPSAPASSSNYSFDEWAPLIHAVCLGSSISGRIRSNFAAVTKIGRLLSITCYSLKAGYSVGK